MTDPKRTQGKTDKGGREMEDQRRTRETERKGEHHPLPHKQGDTRSQRESRRM